MKAFIVSRYKSKDAVGFGEMPEPELRDDESWYSYTPLA